MSARKRPFHIYSVFVSQEAAPDALMTEMIYHDSSLRRAQVAFAQAVMTRRDVYTMISNCWPGCTSSGPSLPLPCFLHVASGGRQ